MSSSESEGENLPCGSQPLDAGFLNALKFGGGALAAKTPGGGRPLNAPADEKAASARERWLGACGA